MALILGDRIQETSTSVGTGTITLAGAITGYQSFAVVGNTNTTYYTIADQSGSNWEVGIGTYYLANTSLARTTILASSNANAVVTFGAGTKSVFVTYPAEKAVYLDAGNVTTITNFASSNVLITGGTISGSNITIPAANVTGLGTMATQNANAIAVTGGTLNNVVIGGTTANLATFTNVTAAYHVATANISGNSATGAISYGNLSYSDVNIFASYTAGANNYVQKIIQNTSNGTTASVDFIVSNNLGNATAFYGNFGMNSANFAGTGALSSPNSVYLYSSTSDLAIGTTSANAIHFVINSGATDAMTVFANSTVSAPVLVGTSANFSGNATTIALNTVNIVEPTTVSGTGAASTINFDVNTQSVYYSTANATANWTVNFRGSSTQTLANALANNQTITCSLLATQGATAYYNSLVQIDGSTVTPKWQGGTAPTSGDAAAVDVYNYVITKTSTAPAYTVLASVTKFA
jgi:hypothetical protein